MHKNRRQGVGLPCGRWGSGAAAAVAVLETRRQDSDLQLSGCRTSTWHFQGGNQEELVRIVNDARHLSVAGLRQRRLRLFLQVWRWLIWGESETVELGYWVGREKAQRM